MAEIRKVEILIDSKNGSSKQAEMEKISADAIAEIGVQLENLMKDMEKFALLGNTYIKGLREMRMGVVHELTLMRSSLSDLRTFFLSKDHETEIARLKDFIDVCERLERLTKNGTLDKVADVMLKLEGA